MTGRDLFKLLKNELHKHLLPYWIEQRGKHPRLCIAFANGTRYLTVPSTPSDRRSAKNCLAQLRRLIREAAEAPAGACLGRHACAACA